MLEQLNRSDYAAHNSPYNGLMSTIVDSILGTKQAYPSYIPIREFISQLPSAAQAHKEIVVVKAPAKRPLNSRIELDTTGLDAYENVVFSSLVWGSYSLYCLVGEMGSGKTALVAQLASVLSRRRTVACTSCGATSCIPIVVTLDFNEGFAKTVSTDEIVRRFEKRMFAQLNARLKTLFGENYDVGAFVAYALRHEAFDILAEFHVFAESVIDDGEWKRSTNKKRADALFAFIRGQDDLQYQLELLMRLLAYVRRRVQPDSSCILLIYDNIDKIQYEAQMEILYAVMSYQHMADVRVLVTLRRTSFEKLASQRVYSFGAINHAGAEPLTVVKLRLTHYLEHFEDEAQTAVLEPETAMALKRRMKYVLSILEHNSSSYVVEALRAFPGRSVRLCMFMMVRAFVNQTMPFDAETVSMSDLARAIIIGDSADGRMTFNDDVVANILHDGISHVPSLLCLRILGILKEYQDAGSRRTLGNLIALLREIDEWSVSDILYALNYLMNVKRPLVWADGVTAFDIANSKKWLPAREILFLSSAGEAYLRTLAMQLVYFQECCLPMDWPEGVPFSMDMRSIDERMRLVRRCVFEIQRMDSEQVKRYTARKRRAGEQSLPLAFISNRILYGLGRAAHAIFAKHRENSGKVAEEWQNWYGQIISSIDLERELTGQANKRLEDLAETYRVALADAVLESST